MADGFELKNQTLLLSTEAPGGIYNSAQLKKIASLSETESVIVKATEDQRLAIFVPKDKAEKITREIEAIGLGVRPYQNGLHQPLTCIGEMCKETEQDALGAAMDLTSELDELTLDTPLKIGINGCSRCCVPTHTLDISVIGEARGYRINLGGKNSQIPEFAAFVAEGVPADELSGLLKGVVQRYKDLAQTGESLQDVIYRCGVGDFVDLLAPYSQDAAAGADDPFAGFGESSQDPADGFDELEASVEDTGAALPNDSMADDIGDDFTDDLSDLENDIETGSAEQGTVDVEGDDEFGSDDFKASDFEDQDLDVAFSPNELDNDVSGLAEGDDLDSETIESPDNETIDDLDLDEPGLVESSGNDVKAEDFSDSDDELTDFDGEDLGMDLTDHNLEFTADEKTSSPNIDDMKGLEDLEALERQSSTDTIEDEFSAAELTTDDLGDLDAESLNFETTATSNGDDPMVGVEDLEDDSLLVSENDEDFEDIENLNPDPEFSTRDMMGSADDLDIELAVGGDFGSAPLEDISPREFQAAATANFDDDNIDDLSIEDEFNDNEESNLDTIDDLDTVEDLDFETFSSDDKQSESAMLSSEDELVEEEVAQNEEFADAKEISDDEADAFEDKLSESIANESEFGQLEDDNADSRFEAVRLVETGGLGPRLRSGDVDESLGLNDPSQAAVLEQAEKVAEAVEDFGDMDPDEAGSVAMGTSRGFGLQGVDLGPDGQVILQFDSGASMHIDGSQLHTQREFTISGQKVVLSPSMDGVHIEYAGIGIFLPKKKVA